MVRSAVRSFLRISSLLSLVALGACSYTRPEGVMANGESSQLFFSGLSDAATNPLAVGYAVKVTVERHSAGNEQCHGLGVRDHAITTGAGAVRPQGGSLDTEHCSSVPADAVTLVSAACTDDTCAVAVVSNDARAVTLTVTGAHPGTGHLRVALKSSDGNTYEDSVTVRFEAPSRIRLAADARELAAMSGPVLPGVAITKPLAWVVDASGEALEIADDALVATTEGSAFVETTDYPSLHAEAPGHTVLRWTYASVPDRTLDLEVVDPSEARALFVYAPLERAPAGTAESAAFVDPADAPAGAAAAEPASGRITSLELLENDFGTYPLRVRLADGRLALCNVEDPVVAPSALGSPLGGAIDLSTFDFEAKAVGGGTLTVRAAATASVTLPVKVSARPQR